MTLGVSIVGKKLDQSVFKPFRTIDDILAYKKAMRKAPAGNVPISIVKSGDTIFVSGRLFKANGLSHDPNIGALSLICAAIRKLGWQGEIVITQHGLKQRHLTSNNKFIIIANRLKIKINKLKLPKSNLKARYWKYETNGEKLATIFIHLLVENFTKGLSIFENHAGCEKGYFIGAKDQPIALEKYSDKAAYKKGDKSKIIHIPDLILLDVDRNEIVNIEGKQYKNRLQAIDELHGYRDIEQKYIKKYYPTYKIIRTVVLYGSRETKVAEVEVGFLLNEEGGMVLGIKAPAIFKEAIRRFLTFMHK